MIKTSVLGADFVVMKHGMKIIFCLSYKLWIVGILLLGTSLIYGDNISVIQSTQHPDSTLNKKSNYICYHVTWEYFSMGYSVTSHIPTNNNPNNFSKNICIGRSRGILWVKCCMIYMMSNNHNFVTVLVQNFYYLCFILPSLRELENCGCENLRRFRNFRHAYRIWVSLYFIL